VPPIRKLEELIKAIREEEEKSTREGKGKKQKTTIEPTVQQPKSTDRTLSAVGLIPSRLPLAIHRRKLIEFLKEHGPATRGEIHSETGIPPGSLSELLSGDEFEQHIRGFWALKGQVRK